MAGIVFDLDHTLVHTHSECLPGFDTFEIDEGIVHVRPHALELLRYVIKSRLRLVVWTAGTSSYANEVVTGLWALMGLRSNVGVLVRSRDHTTGKALVKDIAGLRRELKVSLLLLVDDDPRHVYYMESNRGLVELCPPFRANARHARHDMYLLRLRLRLRANLQRTLLSGGARAR